MKDVINGRLQDRNVIIELQDMFIVQYLSLDTLGKGKVQYFDKRIMKFNQEHNYNPALTVSNKKFNYPREFEDNYIEKLCLRIFGKTRMSRMLCYCAVHCI